MLGGQVQVGKFSGVRRMSALEFRDGDLSSTEPVGRVRNIDVEETPREVRESQGDTAKVALVEASVRLRVAPTSRTTTMLLDEYTKVTFVMYTSPPVLFLSLMRERSWTVTGSVKNRWMRGEERRD